MQICTVPNSLLFTFSATGFSFKSNFIHKHQLFIFAVLLRFKIANRIQINSLICKRGDQKKQQRETNNYLGFIAQLKLIFRWLKLKRSWSELNEDFGKSIDGKLKRKLRPAATDDTQQHTDDVACYAAAQCAKLLLLLWTFIRRFRSQNHLRMKDDSHKKTRCVRRTQFKNEKVFLLHRTSNQQPIKGRNV